MADLSITPANVKLRFGSGVSVFTANGAIAQGDVFTAHPTSGYARTVLSTINADYSCEYCGEWQGATLNSAWLIEREGAK